jgi:hypothetical protein
MMQKYVEIDILETASLIQGKERDKEIAVDCI